MWNVQFGDEFDREFGGLPAEVQDELLAQLEVVRKFGPGAKRPRVDTLSGSRHANMKELRFDADDGVWRVAFAFDPNRMAIVLVAGDKSGIANQDKFYKRLIKKADVRFDAHLESLKPRKR
jgi:hypothetical protein